MFTEIDSVIADSNTAHENPVGRTIDHCGIAPTFAGESPVGHR